MDSSPTSDHQRKMARREELREFGERLIREGWLTTKQVCEAGGASAHIPAKLRRQGLVDAERVVMNGATSFLYHPDAVKVVREHMARPGAKRVPQRRKTIDGVVHLSCTACDQFKPEDEFGKYQSNKRRTSSGRQTRCYSCERERCREYYHENRRENIAKSQEAGRIRRQRIAEEGKRLTEEWKRTTIDARELHRRIMEECSEPHETEANVCTRHGLHPDVLRALRRRDEVSLDRADFLLSRFALPDVANEMLPPPPSMPGWSRHHDACTVCGGVESHHQSRGVCNACYHRVRIGLPPRPANGWSMLFHCCQRCGTSDKKHTTRGLCSTCWHQVKARGQMDQFPTIRERSLAMRRAHAEATGMTLPAHRLDQYPPTSTDDDGELDGDCHEGLDDAERRADRAGREDAEPRRGVPEPAA